MENNKTNVILYCRVSTDEQAEKGFSLNYQEQSLKKYCEDYGYNVLKIYREDHSAKNFKRPQWNELKKYSKENKKEVNKVMFTKWDRFSRNVEQALTVIREFDAMGIEINSSDQYLDMTNSDNKMVLTIYLTAGEVERDKISSRTLLGTYQAKCEGYYASRAPYGYTSYRDGSRAKRGVSKDKRSILIPNEKAHFVTRAFELVAMGVESIEASRKRLKAEGMTLEKSAFNDLLKNMVYVGKITVPEFKKEPSRIVDGIHEPLVDMATFIKVQEIFSGKRWYGLKPCHKNLDFPLRDFLTCEACGRQITASFSKGRSKKYGYYHCREKCKTRVSTEQININVASLFVNMQINPNIKELFVDVLKDSEAQINGSKTVQLKNKNERKQILLEQLDRADDMRMSNELPADRYKSIVDRYNAELRTVNMEIEALQSNSESIKQYVDTGINLLANLDVLFMESDYEGKRILAGSLFTGKLILGNDGCRTTNVNEVINVLTRSSKGLEGIKNGQTIKKYSLTVKVPGAEVY